MFLKVCHNCEYCEEKLDSSYCAREGCYSFLSKCIQEKALNMFISANIIRDLNSSENSKAVEKNINGLDYTDF